MSRYRKLPKDKKEKLKEFEKNYYKKLTQNFQYFNQYKKSIMLHKKILRYVSTNFEKICFSKELIDTIHVDIKRILVANKPNGVVIKLPKLNNFVKTFEEEKQMTFILEKKIRKL